MHFCVCAGVRAGGRACVRACVCACVNTNLLQHLIDHHHHHHYNIQSMIQVSMPYCQPKENVFVKCCDLQTYLLLCHMTRPRPRSVSSLPVRTGWPDSRPVGSRCPHTGRCPARSGRQRSLVHSWRCCRPSLSS